MNEKLMQKNQDLVLGVKSSIDSLISHFNTEFTKRQNDNTAPTVIQKPLKQQLEKLNLNTEVSEANPGYDQNKLDQS